LQSDAKTIQRVRSGRTEEFRILVDRYQARAYLLAFRILGRREEAEDAVQDAFVRAYSALDTYLETGTFWPWIRRITVNCSIHRFSRETPSDVVEQMVEDEQPYVDTVEAEVFGKLEAARIGQAIERLPEAYRVAIILRYEEDLTTSEIAEALELSPVAARVRLCRAMKMLCEKMAVTQNEL